MSGFSRQVAWMAVFAVTFAFVEASVVVYLRGLYYPEGFQFPLTLMTEQHRAVELAREAATLIMLAAVAMLAGTTRWMRFGYFLIAFGVWDIFYYVWLKAILDWPASLWDWDILFLIPLPWIAPVIAPLLISLLMVATGWMIVRRMDRGGRFRPGTASWSIASAATVLLLLSFMLDTPPILAGASPSPYKYAFLWGGLVLYMVSFTVAYRSSRLR